MHEQSKIDDFLDSLFVSQRLGPQVVFQTVLPATPPGWSEPEKPWPAPIRSLLKATGFKNLYRHQARAIDAVRNNRHVIVATPTASGKTLVYDLPVLEHFLNDSDFTALYIFPLKALAQDQLQTFEALAAHLEPSRPSAAIYDGDTSAYRRKCIREAPPNVVITNPEMVHLSFLAHHRKWAPFFSRLHMVVVDEVHTYRGVMGSHVAQIFRRFQRICRHYGASPTFVFSSATVANPAQLTKQLTGLDVITIDKNSAPRGRRHLVFLNPVLGPVRAAIVLLKAALEKGLRTIVYTQSRKLTELIALWARNESGAFAAQISAYRAGLLPEERRDIEARLASGDLLAVITTSALELGIDIGDLDLCLLVGYPGSVISTWQRGGRVGRSGQDSALILIAGEDALDQYFMRNPRDFIDREPESAVVNPFNLKIMNQHLVCAAAELTLKTDETILEAGNASAVVARLEKEGQLLKSADGREIYAHRKAPHRNVDLRGAGNRFQIINSQSDQPVGEVDDYRAFRETHPGAVYLHKGDSFVVDRLDLKRRTVFASKARVNYYTRVRAHKLTEILKEKNKKFIWGTDVYIGKIKVTDQVTEYERWRSQTKTIIDRVSLDLPPQIFETEGLWYQIPASIQRKCKSRHFDLMGALHAIEHAAIGIFPLLVMADHNDVGGMSTDFHPQTGSAAIFIYDGIPGGAGLTRSAFANARRLFEYTRKVIRDCPCSAGCPSCIHSPRCGSGNRPMDKKGALFILDRLEARAGPNRITEINGDGSDENSKPSAAQAAFRKKGQKAPAAAAVHTSEDLYFGVFDLETQRSAAEVGGWHRADRMRLSCGVLYDSKKDTFRVYLEDRIAQLIEDLQKVDLVVGFNIERFDYLVLKGYSGFDFSRLNTLDILKDIHHHLGFRLSLAHLALETLGATKQADGLQALKWWKEGRIRDIVDYCKMDVKLTRDLFLFGRQNGYLIFTNRAQKRIRVPVDWQPDRLLSKRA
ncbi:MAG: DEAD/DEAH box helicase [Desulfobacterales bacterium]|jgi:DEAD/DEAH box helicase domain-containing protein